MCCPPTFERFSLRYKIPTAELPTCQQGPGNAAVLTLKVAFCIESAVACLFSLQWLARWHCLLQSNASDPSVCTTGSKTGIFLYIAAHHQHHRIGKVGPKNH